MNAVIPLTYHDHQVRFNFDGWINATDIAKSYGRRLDHWLSTQETEEYIAALGRHLNTRKRGDLIHTRRGAGGGTWLHPKLAVVFARWLDIDFAVWCDMQIDRLLSGDNIIKQRLKVVALEMKEQDRKGSSAGRELALHRYRMPALQHDHDSLMRQMRLPLPQGEVT